MYRDSTLEDEEDREPEGEEVHRESQRDIPDPVAPSHPLALGTLCLPVTFITGASLLVYILVFAALRASEGLRELFRLQYVEALAVAAALIAWFVTIRCQRRPGRLFPRIWALGLSLVNTFLAIYLGYELLLGNTVFPLFHAATLAGLASAIALFPRLVRVRPDQRMLQWIGPLTFFGTLLIFVPAGHWLGAKEVQRTGDELRGLMASLDRVSAGLSEVVAHPWESLADAAEPARAQVDLLEGLGTGIDRRFLSPEIWHKAEVVGLDDELSKSLESLYSAVVGGLAPEAGPRLSALDQPAIWYDPERRQWKKSPRFPELSATVGAYAKGFGQVGQRLGLLGEEAAGWPPRVSALVASQRAELSRHLETRLGQWTDSWVVSRIPGQQALTGKQELSLVELLVLPIGQSSKGAAPAAADIERWMSIPWREAKEWAELDGCELRSYQEEERGETIQYHRLDCFAYSPNPLDTEGATLRLDFRVVYQRAAGSRGTLSPRELYYGFPTPDGIEEEVHQEAAMEALFNACETVVQADVVASTNRGGALTSGFTIQEQGRRIYRVRQPTTRRDERYLTNKSLVETGAEHYE